MPEFTQFDRTKSRMRNLPPNRRGGLAAVLGERLQALAAPTGHDDGECPAGEATDVPAG